ncbi:putative folate-biopterin transporter 3 [Hibiscus syriacus]|uniref:Folate-biopterin transporter 3 n=1 Tax=Hibiscus syriacus TaxID=106335 RepID=A0A6A3A845_HIBSY|nr:putative folate-biopterin transporter 3 [Hibiscus syriacus]
MLVLSLHQNLYLGFALLSLVAGSVGIAIAEVAIDACVTQHTISHPVLVGDMQSLCGLSSSIEALLGFSLSGFLVHLAGAKGVFGLIIILASLVVLVGILLRESRVRNFACGRVKEKFIDASKAMWTTLKCWDVWRSCLYMYLSLALGLHIHEGMFYWYTDAKDGPSFSQEIVGSKFSVGAVGSLFGVLLYQNFLKYHPFRDILFWAQLLYGISGLLDLVLVLRINLKLEGTFFALVMSIDHIGLLSSAWSGSLVLHMLNVTRTQFDNLWISIIIRSMLRLLPIGFLYLIPRSDPNLSILPSEMLRTKRVNDVLEPENIEMATLVLASD